MERAQADNLTRELRMATELSPLLDAEGGLSRFENIVRECLSQHKDKQRVFIRGRDVKRHSNQSPRRGDSMTIAFPPNAVDYFFRYFGIGYEAKSFAEVAADVELHPVYIRQIVRTNIMILEGNHKRDLWYGTL